MPNRTIRQEMVELLKRCMMNSLELSKALSVMEKEVFSHLEHIARSKGKTFIIEPAVCKRCGFVFKRRERFTIPGRCPLCKGESIERPRFGIEE